MSLPQAKAFILHRWGYETATIADILKKPSGTISSHLNRGTKKARQAQWMAEYIGDTENTQPVDYLHIISRVGKVYESRDGTQWRIVGLSDTDGEFTYQMISVGGEKAVAVDSFAQAGSSFTEIPLSEAKESLQEADVMDVGELLEEHST